MWSTNSLPTVFQRIVKNPMKIFSNCAMCTSEKRSRFELPKLLELHGDAGKGNSEIVLMLFPKSTDLKVTNHQCKKPFLLVMQKKYNTRNCYLFSTTIAMIKISIH